MRQSRRTERWGGPFAALIFSLVFSIVFSLVATTTPAAAGSIIEFGILGTKGGTISIA